MGLNRIWSGLVIEELVRCGVTTLCISPGSRSTPLVIAAAEHTRARTLVHTDERGAAFWAMGYAKATGRPAALICTSGTAVANYFPAVIEASQSLAAAPPTPPRRREVVGGSDGKATAAAWTYAPHF